MVVAVSAADGRPAAERVAAAVEAFCRRALAGPVLAYAQIAEPVDPAVEAERLRLRVGYRDAFARVLEDGVAGGELRPHDTRTVAAALVGALGEALVGPLSARDAGSQGGARRHPRPVQPGGSPSMLTSASTHDVTNQAPPLAPYNVFEADLPLREALEREGGGWGVDRLRDAGELAGSPEALRALRARERNEPLLRTHDRYGNRIDEVELDPSWHWALRQAIEREIHCLPWRDPQPGAHVVRGALMAVWSQVNAGVMCPVSMTYSAVPALRESPELAAEWEPRLTRPSYADGALAGMAMTEKQGGSDVRANTTRAEPDGDGALRDQRPQVVLLLPALRRLPHARPGARRAVLLPVRVQRPRLSHPAPEGQARHPLAALQRGGVPRRPGPAGRRGGPRRADDHPHGQPHAAGLPASARPPRCAGASPRRCTTPATAARSASCSPSSR